MPGLALAASNQNLVYQGRIIRPDGTVVNSGNVTFSLAIYSPSPSKCLLYSENITLDMNGSAGLFSLQIGSGTRTDGGAHSLVKVFANGSTLSGLTCQSGTSYTAGSTDDRSLMVSFNDAGTVVTLNPMPIQSVPFALQAHQIEGWGLNNLVKVSNIGSPTTFTTGEMANVKAVGAAACAVNEVLKWNGTTWGCATDATGGAPANAGYGTANKGVVAFDTDATTSGVVVSAGLAKINVGTGANQIVQLDGSGKLPALDGSALTNLAATTFSGVLPIANGGTNSSTALNSNRVMISSSGKIVEAPAMTNGQILVGSTGAAPQVATLGSSNGISITTGAGSLSIATNATDANTASTLVSRDASGNFAASAITNTSNILKASGSGALTMTVPTSVTSYTLTWPSAVGSAGQFLTTDASGNLSWGSPAAVGNASYAAKGVVQFETDASTSGISISAGLAKVNTGTAANQIVKLDGSARLPAVDGSLLTNLNTSSFSGTVGVPQGGTGISSYTAGDMLYATGASALSPLSIGTSGTILSSNGSAPVWSTPSSLGFFVNGGNSFGSIATLGTNDAFGLMVKTNNTARITIDSSGNVGVGTTNPGTKLDVAVSNTNNSPMIRTGSADTTGPGLRLNHNGTGGREYRIVSTGTGNNPGAGKLEFFDQTASATRMIIDSNGYVGIGTMSPSANLDVKGELRLSGSTSGYTGFKPQAAAGSTVWTLPNADGTSGQFLRTDGSGNLSWGAPSATPDGSYSTKGILQGLTDAATSGLNISSGVISVNSGTSANQIVKLNGSAQLPAVDGSLLTNLNAGNIASGVLPVARGGTNNGSLAVTAGGILYTDGTKLMNTGAGTSGQALISAGAGAPTFGTLGVTGGGTGATSYAANSLIMANGTGSALTSMTCSLNQILKWDGTAWSCAADATGTSPGDAGYGSGNKGIVAFDTDAATSGVTVASGLAKLNTGTAANQILKLDGSARIPAVDGSLLTNLDAGNIASGTLPIARGGTNSSTALNNNRLMISSSGAIVEAPAMTNGQIVVGSTGAAPQVATLGSSNGISITTGAGSLSIATNATDANTVSTIVSRDASGNFAAGAITNTSNILKGATSGTLTMTVPTTVTSYTLRWPSAVGSAGQFLSTDASGNLSWGSPSATPDGSYSTKGILQGLTDAATSGLNISSGVISVNSGTAANQIVKLNGSAQLPAVDGSLLTNLSAGNIASGVLPIARGGTNNGSLAVTAGGMIYSDGTKLMNTGAGTSGQALISAAAGAPAFGTLGVAGGGTGLTSGTSGGIPYFASSSTMASSAALTSNGVVLGGGAGAAPTSTSAGTANQVLRVPSGGGAPAFGTVEIAGGGTGATSFAANRLIGTNGTGAAMVNVTCSQNQLLSFDASGNYGCYNASALLNGSYFVSGGNSFTAAATLGTNDAYSLSFKTNNTSRITIDSTGNVGIGTTSPSEVLVVKKDQNTDTNILLSNQDTGASARTTWRFENSSTTAGISLYSVNHATTPSLFRFLSNSTIGDMRFYVNGSDQLTIKPSGNVGIGTTNPGQQLEVNGNVRIGSQTTRATSTNRGQLAQGSTYITTANANTTIDWSRGNIQELSTFLCDGTKTITFSNLQDGAAYTLLISGAAAHSGTCVFSSSGFTFKTSGGNTAPTASKEVLFTFAVINTTVIYNMIDNLQ